MLKVDGNVASSGLDDFSGALKDAFLFKDMRDQQIWKANDTLALKYWKFVYTIVKTLFVFIIYSVFVFLFVMCIGAWGSVIFFVVTIVTFIGYIYFFESVSLDTQ